MSVCALGLALAVAVQTPAAATETRLPPHGRGLSWDEAEVVARTLRRIDRRLRSGRPASETTIVVTERQLNSFVSLCLAERIPPEVEGLELRLERDRLAARATVDLDRLRAKLPEGGVTGLLSLLSGRVSVDLRGRIESGDGMGRLELEEAVIGGVSVPPSVLAQMVGLATRGAERPEGLDIGAPLELPWTARRLRLEPRRLLVEF